MIASDRHSSEKFYATSCPNAPDEAGMQEESASLSATSRGSPANRVPILFVTYA